MTMSLVGGSRSGNALASTILRATLAGAFLFGLQIGSGTDLLFAFLIFFFVVASAAAVTAAGGLKSTVGICVAWFAWQHVLISQIAKLFFWQPADSNLRDPTLTAEAYVCAILSVLAAVVVTRRSTKFLGSPVFGPTQNTKQLLIAFYVSFVAGTLVSEAFTQVRSHGFGASGALGNILAGLGYLQYVAIAAGTAYTILTSKGRRCFAAYSVLPTVVSMAFGVDSAYRGDILIPLLVLMVTAAGYSYKIKLIEVFAVAICLLALNFYVFPYCLLARHVIRISDPAKSAQLAVGLFEKVVEDPTQYQQKVYEKESRGAAAVSYYKTYSPILDRESMMAWADDVIANSDVHGFYGSESIVAGLNILVPSFLSDHKVIRDPTNIVAHRGTRLVRALDTTTGITTGLVAEAYSSYGMVGVAAILFLVSFMLFMCIRKVFPLMLSRNLWACAVIVALAKVYSEGSVGYLVGVCTYSMFYYLIGMAAIRSASRHLSELTLRPLRT